jgi:paired amphipathic helix protein Sin3a
MVQDDSSSKLWELFRYESARGTRICAAMYHINAHTVMEDACYRVEFR